jgi:hypothetical protein
MNSGSDAAPVVLPLHAPVEQHLSPSLLLPARSLPAFELKFLLPEGRLSEVLAWASHEMEPDSHADAQLGGAYAIRSIYLDTPSLDVLHRTPGFRSRKFRLRRYGREHLVYLERKTKRGDRVLKRRTGVPPADLERLHLSTIEQVWDGQWFHERIARRKLRPVCLLSYERLAFVGRGADGPLRLTIDRRIGCSLTDAFDFHPSAPSVPLLAGQIVLELKFRVALPTPFKGLLSDLRLSPTSVSKYQLGMRSCGVGLEAREVG